MHIPIQITIKNERNSKYLDNFIREKFDKLEQYAQDIIHARVVVEINHQHRQYGNLHNVHMRLTIPQNEIVINKIADKNVYIAIRDAIEAACRQLQSNRRKRLVRRRDRSLE